jgi:hypothetical protein
MSDLLKRKDVKMVMELCPFGLKNFGTDPKKCLTSLMDYGFKLFEIVGREKKVKPILISELLEIYTPEKKNRTNLLCLKVNE